MRFGKRGSRVTDARRYAAFQPWRERLEDRVLMAIDLGGVPPSVGLPTSQGPPPRPPRSPAECTGCGNQHRLM